MKKRVPIVVFAGILGGLLLWQALGPRESIYQGKRVSEHLRGFAQDGTQIDSQPPFGLLLTFQPSPERTLAWEAFSHFDTNALRTVHTWLRARDSGLLRMVDKIAARQSIVPYSRLPDWRKRQAAVSAIARLGRRAEPLADLLGPLLNDPDHARMAVHALWHIHPEKEQAILLLTNAFQWAPHETLSALGGFESKASGAMPLLVEALHGTNAVVRAAAAVAVARVGTEDPEIISLIAPNLDGPNIQAYASTHQMCLWALARIGPAALPVLPKITRFANDPDPAVRNAAQKAIVHIAGEL